MASTFFERIDHLSREVGTGHITARCEVNQPYAQNQHQSVWFKHPHGGRAFYLGGPLLENAYGLLSSIARGAITPGGSLLSMRMIEVAEWMARAVLENAPVETGQLRLSGHPSVESHGSIVYDRPPVAPREAD